MTTNHWLYPSCQKAVNQVVVVFDALLVHFSYALRKDPCPADREAVMIHLDVKNKRCYSTRKVPGFLLHYRIFVDNFRESLPPHSSALQCLAPIGDNCRKQRPQSRSLVSGTVDCAGICPSCFRLCLAIKIHVNKFCKISKALF